jgi:hypothetical protein
MKAKLTWQVFVLGKAGAKVGHKSYDTNVTNDADMLTVWRYARLAKYSLTIPVHCVAQTKSHLQWKGSQIR